MQFQFIGWKSTPALRLSLLVFTAIGVGYTAFVFFQLRSWPAFRPLAICALMLALVVIEWRNRHRPMLEVTESELRYAWNDVLPVRSVPLHEIESVELSGKRRAVVHLHSGRRMLVWLPWIHGISRGQAALALRDLARAVANHA
jgi:hypothetical protein